jgi:myo-inositol 2-dehydrogenase/D-chiro-inositol 1-dehydrogenase
MKNLSVGVGVIGTGAMGSVHARNLARRTPGAYVVAVMDIDPEQAESVAAECGGARVYTDASALIGDEDVQAVLIASPDATHAELTIACINAGKLTLCEKPLATTLADAERVLQAETAGGRRLVQVGFMREYDPAHQDLAELVARGAVGQALGFRGVHSNLRLEYDRTVEEVIVNSAVHDIHSARWIMGDEIASVYVQWVAADPARPETCRLLIIQMAFQNGALGTIEYNGDSSYGYKVHVDIAGAQGSAHTRPSSSPSLRRSGTVSQAIDQIWSERFETAYLAEVQAWTRSILAQEPTGPSVWDGTMSLIVADACLHSVKTGQPQPVPVVERPALYGGEG